MPLKLPQDPIFRRRGRPKILGTTRAVLFDDNTLKRIQEYRTYVKNRTGFVPNFTAAVRALVNQGLITLGIPENESEDDEANSR